MISFQPYRFFAAMLLVLFFSGCTHKMRRWTGALLPQAFRHISIGMNKQEVVAQIGEPDIARGSITNKFGQVIEVWEYDVENLYSIPYRQPYWLYFYNGKLARWGKSGDWEKESHTIQEIRFR